MAKWLGLDIGGANLKISDGESARSLAFPLWRDPEGLANQVAKLIGEFPHFDGLAVTMTGELADCFETKAQGVDCILSAVEEAAVSKPIMVWQTGAEFVSPAIAREIPLLVAAANWHALATWVGRLAPEGLSLLMDMGSTTTDIIPMLNGVPIPTGLTDSERLVSGELVYTGIRRTPLCAVAQSVPFRKGTCAVAAEHFATSLDIYLLLGLLDEDPNDTDTANGRPATKAHAHDRLARMICCDRTEVSLCEAIQVAEHFANEQSRQISAAIQQVVSQQSQAVSQVFVSGSGHGVLDSIRQKIAELNSIPWISLANLFQDDISEAACAFAIARLAQERCLLS